MIFALTGDMRAGYMPGSKYSSRGFNSANPTVETVTTAIYRPSKYEMFSKNTNPSGPSAMRAISKKATIRSEFDSGIIAY